MSEETVITAVLMFMCFLSALMFIGMAWELWKHL